MPPDDSGVGYFIWGVDHAAYGPVELPTLVAWIKDERVIADTWIFVERSEGWEKAGHVPELQMLFHGSPLASGPDHATAPTDSAAPLSPAALRHVRILGCLNDEQLERFLQFMETIAVPAGAQLARQGEPGNAMFLLLEGGLRARAMADGRETNLAVLNAGDFFGEMSLFEQGPRSADIVATADSTLLKISASELERLAYEAPDLAAPFLLSVGKCLASRVRADNKRYRDSISFVRTASH